MLDLEPYASLLVMKKRNLIGNFSYRKSHFWVLATITLCALICYANSFHNEFVFDDPLLITKNRLIRDWGNVLEIFQTQLYNGANTWSSFYRPLQNLFYLVEFHTWGENPLGYHLVNTTLHCLNSWLIYGLVLKLTSNWKASLIASLFFVVHPIHVEAVTYISSRGNLLATFFLLLSFWLYLRSFKISSLFSFIFALLSKEFVLVLPVLILIYEVIYKKKKRTFFLKKTFWKTFPYLLIVLIYLLFRLIFLQTEMPINIAPSALPLLVRLEDLITTIMSYFKWLIFPYPLHMERVLSHPEAFFKPQTLLALLFLFSLGWLLFKYRRSRHLLFFSSWFFLSLIPVSNIYPINASLAEAWLYQPSLGWFALLGLLGSYLWEKKRLLLSIFLALFIFYSLLTIRQNRVWRDEFTFYNHTLKYTQGSARIHNNLANLHKREGRTEKAIVHFYKALKLNPNYEFAYNNLGGIFVQRQQLKEAKLLFLKAIEINPKYSSAFHNLGEVYLLENKIDLAEIAFRKSIQLYPYGARSHLSLGKIYIYKKDYNKAKLHLIKAYQSDLENSEFYFQLGNLFFKMTAYNHAILSFQKSLRKNPDNEKAKSKLKRLSLEK